MIKKAFHILVLISVVMSWLSPIHQSASPAIAQGYSARDRAQLLLDLMSVEERVGQVFLVTFTGNQVEEGNQVWDLVVNQHVGGVVLRSDNNNFVGPENTLPELQQLISDLQKTRYDTSSAANYLRTYNPLLIGISQTENLLPTDQILNGITALPSEMTIGATWNTGYAEEAGLILGEELNALGINLFFGPSLDVLDSIQTDAGEKLGVTTFGGDPYWVGKMGQAYIKGLHEGGQYKVAVVPSHFPGIGNSDRLPEQEIATVRKSMEQLKEIELAPFFAITNLDQKRSQIADGLLLTHTRYQGLQGNILPSTKPVSFDANAMEELLTLPQLKPWRENGGLIISDDLGSEAIHRFADPLGTGYDARQVARSVLMAGNDLLYLGNIVASGDADSYSTTVRTIEYFVQKYKEDSAFQLRVNQAALNVLTLKMSLYPSLGEKEVLPDPDRLEVIGQKQDLVEDIVQDAVTLVSPESKDLVTVLPNRPDSNDRIVIISESTTFTQCEKCDVQTVFPGASLLDTLIRLYGSGSGDPIQSTRINAYSYDTLRLILEQVEGTQEVQVVLNSATWIIFAFTDFDRSQQDVSTFKRLFDERPDLVRNKKIIGMSFCEPYFLDATDISKLSAYYAFYTRIPAVYPVAARVLLQELIPTGKLPVSVPGIGFDLHLVTSPDPDQLIPLTIEAPIDQGTPVSTPPTGYSQPLLYKAGDTVPVKAGLIVDQNGNPVPDGTKVSFIIDTRSTSGSVEQLEAETVDGYARVMYVIPSIGSLELRVTAPPALTSQILRLDITDAGGIITSFEPTPVITAENEPTPTDIPPTPTPAPLLVRSHGEGKLAFPDWILATALIFGACFLFTRVSNPYLSGKWRLNIILFMGGGGYLAYLYLALGLPGAQSIINQNGTLFTLLCVCGGLLIGLGMGWLLYRTRKEQR